MNWRQASGILVDLDGTLFRGRTVIPGAVEFMEAVQHADVPYLYWTNNSTRTPTAVADHLRQLGFAATTDDVYTSSMALRDVLKGRFGSDPGLRTFVVGQEGLRAAMGEVSRVVDEASPVDAVEVVAVGLDRSVHYDRLRLATRYLLAGAAFYATNPDRLIWEDDGLAPGAGSLVALLEAAVDRRAEVVGKPQPTFVQTACAKLGIRPQDAVVIGDNPSTDIAAGRAAGALTVLVESGLHEGMRAQTEPDMRVATLGELV